ncbi:hypothetical protein PAXINDRAFT_17807 [Paxillus involutus ATCC 200175]|uniref:Uncharacterized protein n=1 Tax=Paxillus involutus ATCC 200175 TaxID=664439 RepID=A0A0C9TDN9_PAXIN|nr:hypothetical protein PAXINDRAFT_17807 [Paxillus involutus ATCC 200175]
MANALRQVWLSQGLLAPLDLLRHLTSLYIEEIDFAGYTALRIIWPRSIRHLLTITTIDMPWPEKVICQFQIIPPNPTESDFQGAYNKLLYTLFPADTDFTVVPLYLKPASSANFSDYYITAFEIIFKNTPVFILQLKKPANLDFISLIAPRS